MEDVELAPISSADHMRGPSNAPVTLIEYGDFECPYCHQAHALVAQLERRFPNRFRFVFRQFPLRDIHPRAEAAAEAAEAAAAQGKFWEMYDALYSQKRILSDADLRAYAGDIGVPDRSRFERELAERRYESELDAAIERAEASGVEGTPMFFINGEPFEDDPSIETLSAALAQAEAAAA